MAIFLLTIVIMNSILKKDYGKETKMQKLHFAYIFGFIGALSLVCMGYAFMANLTGYTLLTEHGVNPIQLFGALNLTFCIVTFFALSLAKFSPKGSTHKALFAMTGFMASAGVIGMCSYETSKISSLVLFINIFGFYFTAKTLLILVSMQFRPWTSTE